MTLTLEQPGPPNLAYARAADRPHLERTAAAQSARGFRVTVADSGAHAREIVLGLLPEGAEVHSALSETLRELGITEAIEASGRYRSVRVALAALDRETQRREMQRLGAAPDYVVGSAHAITDDGQIVVGSGSGSQLGAYAYAAGQVVLVVGHQKLVRDLDDGLRRLQEYCLPLEFARMQTLGRAGSLLAKTLLLHQEPAGRITVVLVPETLGY